MLAFFVPMFAMVPSYIMTVRLLSQRAKFVRNNSLLLTNPSIGGTSSNHQASKHSSLETSGEIQVRHQLRDDNLTCESGNNNISRIVGSSSLRDINHNKATVIIRQAQDVGGSKKTMDSQEVVAREGSPSLTDYLQKKGEGLNITKHVSSTDCNDDNKHPSSTLDNHIKLIQPNYIDERYSSECSRRGKSCDCMTYRLVSKTHSAHSTLRSLNLKKARDNRLLVAANGENCPVASSKSHGNKLKSSTSCNLTTLSINNFGAPDRFKSSIDLSLCGCEKISGKKQSPQLQNSPPIRQVKTRKCHKRCCSKSSCRYYLKTSNFDLLNGELKGTKYIDEDECSASLVKRNSQQVNRCQLVGSSTLISTYNQQSSRIIKCCRMSESPCSKCNDSSLNEDQTNTRDITKESSVLNCEQCHKTIVSNYCCQKCCILNTNCIPLNQKLKSTYTLKKEQQQQQSKTITPSSPPNRDILEHVPSLNEIDLPRESQDLKKLVSSTTSDSNQTLSGLTTILNNNSCFQQQEQQWKLGSGDSQIGKSSNSLSFSKCDSPDLKLGSTTDKIKDTENENHHQEGENIHGELNQRRRSRHIDSTRENNRTESPLSSSAIVEFGSIKANVTREGR